MKRVMTILAILLLPLSVWAMTPVSDSDLSNVTGQAGVNINADLIMNIGLGTMAWGDATGVDAYASLGTSWPTATGPGYVGVTGFNITNLRIKARETNNFGTGYAGAGTVSGGAWNTLLLKPITIDVATDPAVNGGRTFVRFGLGSLQITMNELNFDVKLGTSGAGLLASTEKLGSVHLGAIGIFINPKSYVDIYSHGSSGVTLSMNIIIDQFNMSYISWGDSDGLPGGNPGLGTSGVTYWMVPGTASTAGYIGLQNLSIGGPITITGTVAIDVVTSSLGIYSHNTTPTTVCHISFPSLFNVNVAGPITAQVRLSDQRYLNGVSMGTLGNIYISGFNLDILGNSWVDIWAH